MELKPDWKENLEAMAAAADGEEAEAATVPDVGAVEVGFAEAEGGVGPGVAGEPREDRPVSPLKERKS